MQGTESFSDGAGRRSGRSLASAKMPGSQADDPDVGLQLRAHKTVGRPVHQDEDLLHRLFRIGKTGVLRQREETARVTTVKEEEGFLVPLDQGTKESSITLLVLLVCMEGRGTGHGSSGMNIVPATVHCPTDSFTAGCWPAPSSGSRCWLRSPFRRWRRGRRRG